MQVHLPFGKDYTFWDKGFSQGHSDVIRKIEVLLEEKQYTVPIEKSLEPIINVENQELTIRYKYTSYNIIIFFQLNFYIFYFFYKFLRNICKIIF